MKKLIPHSIIIISLLASFGCTPSLQRHLKKMTGEKISFDLQLTQVTGSNRDMQFNIKRDSSIKFVVIYDSMECSSCRVSMLDQYNDIFESSKKEETKFVPIIIFSPKIKQQSEITTDLENSTFTYSVYIDNNNDFYKINPYIPSNSRLHSFLLNHNNEIVLAGSPLNNPTLWKLYEDTIRSLNMRTNK